MQKRKMDISLNVLTLEKRLLLLNNFINNFQEGTLPEEGRFVVHDGKLETEENKRTMYRDINDFASYTIYNLKKMEDNTIDITEENHFLTFGEYKKWIRTVQLIHYTIGKCGIIYNDIISMQKEEPVYVDEYYHHNKVSTENEKVKTK